MRINTSGMHRYDRGYSAITWENQTQYKVQCNISGNMYGETAWEPATKNRFSRPVF